MKNNPLKSILGLAMISLLLTMFTPTNTFAQRDARKSKDKDKKVKVVTPVKQYNKYPRRGAQVTTLPKKTVIVSHRNTKYHYDNGIYYKPVGSSYVVTRPPIGIRVSVLPPNHYQVVLGGHPYYYYYGSYYVPFSGGGYEVIAPPVGARVDALPNGYEVFEMDGLVYYRLDATYYKAVVEPNGRVVYEVVRS